MGEWVNGFWPEPRVLTKRVRGRVLTFWEKYWETYNYALELISLAIIDVIKLIMTRYEWIGGGIER